MRGLDEPIVVANEADLAVETVGLVVMNLGDMIRLDY